MQIRKLQENSRSETIKEFFVDGNLFPATIEEVMGIHIWDSTVYTFREALDLSVARTSTEVLDPSRVL